MRIEVRLPGMKRMIRKMRLVEGISTDVLHDRMGVADIEDIIIQSCLQWNGHVGACVKS